MKKFVILFFFTLIIKAQADNKIIYGGFSYGSILPENTFTKYVHDRSNGQSSIDGKIVSQVELNIPTYSKENLPDKLLSIKAVKPGSRNL